MSAKWLSAMNLIPTRVEPSSPASARKCAHHQGDLLPFEFEHEHEAGDDVVLVVDGAAPVDVATVARGAEGREGPLLGVNIERTLVWPMMAGVSSSRCP